MRRLAGADAHFLHQETRVQHLHTLKIFIVDPSQSPNEFSYARVREQMSRIVQHVGAYRWRLVRVPFGLGLPSWATSETVDLDYHLRRAAVPAPGGPVEFAEMASIIASFPLERDRPLWQLWVVEGLEHGRIATVMKIHHALADGGSSARLLEESMRVSGLAEDGMIEPPDRIPHPARVLADAVLYDLRLAARLPSLIARSLRGLRVTAERRRARLPTPPRPYSSPRTRFNRPLTPHRWYANVTVPLADVKQVRAAFGVSINDVLLALTSGALRSYLRAHGELPQQTLTASVPVSVRKPGERLQYGNRLASWFVPLGTDLDDPVARLRAVARGAAVARENLAVKDAELQHDWLEQWLPWSVFMGRITPMVRRFRRRPVFNVIVSNVRGPETELSYQGTRLVGIQSMGPLMGDMGLNVTAWSYCDDFSIGIVACREHVPDVWNLAERFREAMRELQQAAAAATPPTPLAASGSA